MATNGDLPPHPDISLPAPENLNKNFILQEIQDNIGGYKELFPHVDLDVVSEQVKDVKEKHVSAEVRGSCSAHSRANSGSDHVSGPNSPIFASLQAHVHIQRCVQRVGSRDAEEGDIVPKWVLCK